MGFSETFVQIKTSFSKTLFKPENFLGKLASMFRPFTWFTTTWALGMVIIIIALPWWPRPRRPDLRFGVVNQKLLR